MTITTERVTYDRVFGDCTFVGKEQEDTHDTANEGRQHVPRLPRVGDTAPSESDDGRRRRGNNKSVAAARE
jgi:hypothetical protein